MVNGKTDTWIKDVIIFIILVALILLAARGAMGDTVEVPKIRQRREPKLLGEIISRIPAVLPVIGDTRTYVVRPDGRQPDPQNIVSTAHEYTHGLNGFIRNRFGRGTSRDNAAYLPGGHALVLPEPPNITLSEIKSKTPHFVPPSPEEFDIDRNVIQAWNNQPLYLVDELSAYLCGSVVGIEYGLRDRAKDSLRRAEGVFRYCVTLANLARERGYSHADELKQFLIRVRQYMETLYQKLLTPNPSPE